MKNLTGLLLLNFFLLGTMSSFADTCPQAKQLDPALPPPAGWSYLVNPNLSLETYHFSSAIHSLNGAFYYLQVICRYEACPSYLCPAFTLISDKTYEQPAEALPPWNHRSVLQYTLTCMPGDHDPVHCIFQ